MDGVLGLGRSLKVLATCPPAQGSPLDAPERRVGVDLLVFDTSLPDLARLTLTAEFAAAPKMRSVGKPIGGAGERVAGLPETELQPGESISEYRKTGGPNDPIGLVEAVSAWSPAHNRADRLHRKGVDETSEEPCAEESLHTCGALPPHVGPRTHSPRTRNEVALE